MCECVLFGPSSRTHAVRLFPRSFPSHTQTFWGGVEHERDRRERRPAEARDGVELQQGLAGAGSRAGEPRALPAILGGSALPCALSPLWTGAAWRAHSNQETVTDV